MKTDNIVKLHEAEGDPLVLLKKDGKFAGILFPAFLFGVAVLVS